MATPFINTIGVDQQPVSPGDLAIEERLASMMRWNALAYLLKARIYLTEGADGIGRGDTRAALRAFFGMDAARIVRATKSRLT